VTIVQVAGIAKLRSAVVTHPAAKVLVVEDDDSMREAIERLLDAGGFRCRAYASAVALLAQGVEADAACVISDLRMPAMSGLELLAALRERDVSLPFILITAHDQPGMRQQALSNGATAYLVKPFRGTFLLDAVRSAIKLPPQAA
jgi:two-component system response regulator FixJ